MKSQEKGMIYIISLLKYIFQFVYNWYFSKEGPPQLKYSQKMCRISTIGTI